eukprot:jgi/Phyca11/4643/fgenesh1_pm.PHYCAscaffold_2_\
MLFTIAFGMELAVPLSESITCRLFIKNGQPYGSCAKVEEYFESKLPGQWSSDFAIYFKPTNNAYQKDFHVLCTDSDAMRVQLDKAWHKARLRNGGQKAGFVLELYIYVPKPVSQPATIRRATASRIQEQMPQVAGLLREQGIAAGPATQTYMATTQARLPDGAPLAQAAMDETLQREQQQAAAEYHLVRIKIQDVPVAMQVNISDLRLAHGLPSFSLRPSFRAPTAVATEAPTEDMEDIDHLDN